MIHRLPKLSITRVLLTLLCLISTSTSAPALAEDKVKTKHYADINTQRRQAVGQRCATKLEAAQAQFEKGKWSAAEHTLITAGAKICASSYERSQRWNYLAYVYVSQQKYREALTSYLKVLDEENTDPGMKVSTYHSLAQLYFQLEDYSNAARYTERWMQASKQVDAATKALLAQTYYQLGRKKESLRYLNQAIAEYQDRGELPPENWWALQSLLYADSGKNSQALEPMKQLIKHYPNYRYWYHLGGIFSELEKNVEHLVSSEVIYLAGAMDKERELVSLAYLYLGAEVPYRSAQILDTGFKAGDIHPNRKNLELLGAAWQQAGEGEKARSTLEKAARLSGKGDIYLRLANVYLDLGNNKKAAGSAQQALTKGGLNKPGSAYLLLGTAQLNLQCFPAAISAFTKALNYKASAKTAQQWLNYSRSEKERREQLRRAGAVFSECQ